MSADGIRIVIYPLFAAGADETDQLIEKLCDVMEAHHGRAKSDDDAVQSLLTVEEYEYPDLDEAGVEEWVISRLGPDSLRIYMPGGFSEDAEAASTSDDLGSSPKTSGAGRGAGEGAERG